MAKRKAARPTRKAARTRSGATRTRARSGAKRTASRKAARKSTRAAAKTARRKTAKRGAKGVVARKAARKATGRARSGKAPARKAPARKTTAEKALPPRKAPGLERARRTIVDDDVVPTPPSSLDLDRSASGFRTGRRELREKYAAHTETSPALTGGDVDADWESAYSVGDEAPGGDSPTPDQDIVDDIGRAVGNEYQDNEELKGADKLAKRDKKRWELDPASSDDWDER